jgi:hypothetical protein
MAIFRDMYCSACGRVTADVDCSDVRGDIRCAQCQTVTVHRAACNGGMKTRYRVNDWPTDPEFYRGQVKVIGAEATDSEGEPVRRYDSATKTRGAPMTDAPQYHNGTTERETRRDMIKHATRRQRGRSPIVIDMGKRNG